MVGDLTFRSPRQWSVFNQVATFYHFCLALDKINKNFNLKCKKYWFWKYLEMISSSIKTRNIKNYINNRWFIKCSFTTRTCTQLFSFIHRRDVQTTYKRRSGGMAPPFEPRRRKINSSPLFSHPASRMVNLQARLHSDEKLRRQQEKQIAVPRTILHGMGGLRTGEGVGTERP